MATALEDEIRRRRIEDALLLDTPNLDDSSEPDKPDTADKDVYGDWRKWPSVSPEEAADIPTIEQPAVPAGHVDLAPPGHIDLTPPAPQPPQGIQTDPESGQRYVADPTVPAGIVPYAELATPADKEAFKPTDVTLPKLTSEGTAPVQPAPDRLDQVERATLVAFPKGAPATMPWHPAAEAPDTLTQVERGQLVKKPPAPDSLTQVERALPTGPKAPGTHTELAPPGQMDLRPDEPQAVKPAAVQPSPSAQPTVKPVADDWKTWTTTDGTPAEPAVSVPASTVAPMNAPNGKAPVALIIHHTSGRNSAESVVDDWRTHRPGVGAQYIMDRDGTIHETNKEFGYNGTGNFLHSVISGVSNQTAVGIEVIANDDADMTPAQIESLKKFAGPGGQYANVPVYGHSQVSPGDRDNEGVRGVAAINEARKAGGDANAIDSSQVLQQLNASGLTTTHYGYAGDPNLDAESAAGHGKYVQQMVSGYDVALNDAAARLVGNPKPGEEFQYAGRTWRYADKVPEKYSDARFDIFDSNNTALSGGKLGGTSQKTAEAPKKQDWESWATLSPADEATITKAQTDQFKILDAVNQNTPNKGAFWKILNSEVPGVSSNTLQAYRDQFRKQVTTYALDYYKPGNPDITPEQAFQKATGDADFGTLIGEVATKIVPNLNSAAIAMERSQDTIDENRVMDFLKTINPNVAPEKLVEVKRTLMAENPQDRAAQINYMIQMSGQEFPGLRPEDIADSFDRISDPVYQAKRKAALDLAVAKNQHDLQTDPRLVNTPAEGVTQFLSAMPKNISEMLTPVIGQSAMLSEIYTGTADQLRKEHPDWSEDEIKQKATASTAAQIGPQVIIGMMTGGVLSAATKGIEQPLLELGARLGLHSTVAGVAGGIQKIAQNATEGKPLMDGVQEAVTANAPYGLLGGALAGRTEVAPKGEPLETGRVHGPEEQINTFRPHGPGEPEAQPSGVQRPVTVEQNVPDTSGAKWYDQPPIVTRGTERTTFTPAELAEQAATVTGRTPEELQTAAERLHPSMDFTQRSVFLNSDEVQRAEIEKAQAAQAPQPTPEQQVLVNRANVVRGSTGAGSVGESEPWVSKIANRFTAERMASGELGHIEPGIGVTKEEMLSAGLKMPPETVNQHISNLMNNAGGDPKLQAAAVRAEEARLTQRSRDLSLISESDPKNSQAKLDAENAFKDLTDFHNGPVAKLKNNWHAQGMTLQGEIPVDLSTYNGLREQFLKDVGKPPPASMEPVMRNTAKKVRDAKVAETMAMQKLGMEIEKQNARRFLPTDEQVREKIIKKMKVEPCPT